MSEAAYLTCPHSKACSVCSWIETPYAEQTENKKKALAEALRQAQIAFPTDIAFRTVGSSAIRDRVDLTYHQGRYGFFKKADREVFDLEYCPLMSKELSSFFQDVKKISLPIQKGSLRLRVSPSGQRGIWLDFANEDVRDLLAEKTAFNSLLDLGFVEIGQRRKKLTREMKLKDPEFHKWTRSWVGGKAIDLYSLVGSFSQVGDLANQALIRELETFFTQTNTLKWVEFGSGHGNLTFPLAGENRSVEALEYDALALEGLKKSLSENPSFQGRIHPQLGDFQRHKLYAFQKDQGILVNPPRSGLQKFLDPLFEISKESRPRDLIYMSCFLDSFTKDGMRLKELGYEIQKLSIVDQFPQSSHFEILSQWRLL